VDTHLSCLQAKCGSGGDGQAGGAGQEKE